MFGFKAKKNEFEQKYELGEKLGEGQFAQVFEGWKLDDKEKTIYAVKCVSRAKLTTKEDIEGLALEIKILQELDHQGIIRLFDVINTKETCYLVTELAQGGELFARIVEKANSGNYTEREAALIVRQVAESLAYCHSRNVVHRDLKPENLLLTDKSDKGAVKLADFGFAAYCHEPLNEGCGTLIYVAPEILQGASYTTTPDMWSLGVITYILLCGYPPFFSSNQKELTEKIMRGKYKFKAADWEHVSDDGKDFIRRLLKRNPEERMTADMALGHIWIRTYADEERGLSLEKPERLEPLAIGGKIKQYQAEMMLLQMAMRLKAHTKLSNMLLGFDPTKALEGESADAEEI